MATARSRQKAARAGRKPRTAELPLCGPDDLAVVVEWEQDGSGLRGQVIAENVGGRACRLPGKPTVTPVAPDGTPLDVRNVVSLELLSPGYVDLQPGDRAAARVRWSSWCGPRPADRARVEWDGSSVVAPVRGPRQPECVPDWPDNLNPWWFLPIPPAQDTPSGPR
jgi:hypothetical protein